MYETTKRKASWNPERNKQHLCNSGLLRETAEKKNDIIGNILKVNNVFAKDLKLVSSTQVKVAHYLQLQSIWYPLLASLATHNTYEMHTYKYKYKIKILKNETPTYLVYN